MTTPHIPMPLRAVAGLAAVTIDEARRLPDRLVGLPVLAVSTALQTSLRVQQHYAELVARGDQLLGQLRTQTDGAPPWARFDDEEPTLRPPSGFDVTATDFDDLGAPYDAAVGGVGTISVDDVDAEEEVADAAAVRAAEDAEDAAAALAAELAEAAEDAAAEPAAEPPEPPLPRYGELSVPQLRARLRNLTEPQLEQLLAYERATAARPPYLTMLENRLTTVRAR